MRNINNNVLRTKYLIYPRFQLTLIGINAAVLLLLVGAVLFQLYRSFENLRERGLNAGIDPSHVYFRFLDHQASTVYSYLLVSLALGVFISFVTTLFLSHKLAGPVVRLHTYFKELAEGDVEKVKPLQFRKRDFFSTLPVVINEAISHLKQPTAEWVKEKKNAA